jgi:hypothetical protein
MKRFLLMLGIAACTISAQAQWIVADPTNLVQNIITAIQGVSTASNMVNNVKECVKIYEQGKEYYDALKSVNNLIKDAQKVKKTVEMVSQITDIYVVNFQKMLTDTNYSDDELSAIATGYTKLLEQSNDVLTELKTVVSSSSLSMTDKERMDVVNHCYDMMLNHRNLVQYYTNKNISVSYLRSKKKGDAERVTALYGNPDKRYW